MPASPRTVSLLTRGHERARGRTLKPTAGSSQRSLSTGLLGQASASHDCSGGWLKQPRAGIARPSPTARLMRSAFCEPAFPGVRVWVDSLQLTLEPNSRLQGWELADLDKELRHVLHEVRAGAERGGPTGTLADMLADDASSSDG